MADDRTPRGGEGSDDKTKAEQMKELKKEEKAQKKAQKKEMKERRKQLEEQEDDGSEEKFGSKLVLFFVTILIIAIWLGIIVILIKSDVGGFGSSVLYPILKDVPYVNKILPEVEGEYEDETEEASPYGSLDEALVRIRELELQLDESLAQNEQDSETIEDLESQVDDLMVYKEDEAAFEKEKEKYYEEVVFGDDAPDISEYRSYYEEIDPENAAVLYQQVIEQIDYDDDVADYVKTFTEMKAKDAAAIFDSMTDNLSLVADILNNMSATNRADILSEMDVDTAALLTEMLEP